VSTDRVHGHVVYPPCIYTCIRPSTWRVRAVYTAVYTGRTHTRPCNLSCSRRVHGHGRGPCTSPCRRPCTGPPVPYMYPCVHGCVHGLCIRPRTRHIHVHPCTRPVNENYTICNFVISCNLCIQKYTSVNKAKHHIAFHRKLIKYGVTVKRYL